MLTGEMLERKFDFFGDLNTTEYYYDALGRRVRKMLIDHLVSSKSFERRFVYDGDDRIADFNEENEVLAIHTHSTIRVDDTLSTEVTQAGRIAGISQFAESYFYLKDSLGTITDIADSAGNLVQHYVYSSFGKIIKITNSAEQITTSPEFKAEFTFTNREWDEETGLYYYRARYFDSESGRFIQSDPDAGRLSNPSSFASKYAYVQNNPTSLIDPFGLYSLRLTTSDITKMNVVRNALGDFYDKYQTEINAALIIAGTATLTVAT